MGNFMKMNSSMLNKIRIYISDDRKFVFGSFISNLQYQEIENRCSMILLDYCENKETI